MSKVFNNFENVNPAFVFSQNWRFKWILRCSRRDWNWMLPRSSFQEHFKTYEVLSTLLTAVRFGLNTFRNHHLMKFNRVTDLQTNELVYTVTYTSCCTAAWRCDDVQYEINTPSEPVIIIFTILYENIAFV